MGRRMSKVLSVLLTVLLLFGASPVNAAPLKGLIIHLLNIDNNVNAKREEVLAAQQSVRAAQAGWLPSLQISGYTGRQKRDLDNQDDTSFYINQQEAEIKQLIYDFGKTGAGIESAKLSYLKSKVHYEGVIQDTVLKGLTAYIQLYGAVKELSYARRYKENVLKQLTMEKLKRKKGSGLSTDVLESKAQYIGAKSRVVLALGDLDLAINAFYAVFREKPVNFTRFTLPRHLKSVMPYSESRAVQISREFNTEILLQHLDVGIARQNVRKGWSRFGPVISLKGIAKREFNLASVRGDVHDYQAQVRFDYPLYSGGGDSANLRSARHQLNSTTEILNQKLNDIRETVKNDWAKRTIQMQNRNVLGRQEKVLKEFVTLSEKVRKLGKKTLLEVLVADTNYINTSSAKMKAKISSEISYYRLLRDMNMLKIKNIFVFFKKIKFSHVERKKSRKIMITKLVAPVDKKYKIIKLRAKQVLKRKKGFVAHWVAGHVQRKLKVKRIKKDTFKFKNKRALRKIATLVRPVNKDHNKKTRKSWVKRRVGNKRGFVAHLITGHAERRVKIKRIKKAPLKIKNLHVFRLTRIRKYKEKSEVKIFQPARHVTQHGKRKARHKIMFSNNKPRYNVNKHYDSQMFS